MLCFKIVFLRMYRESLPPISFLTTAHQSGTEATHQVPATSCTCCNVTQLHVFYVDPLDLHPLCRLCADTLGFPNCPAILTAATAASHSISLLLITFLCKVAVDHQSSPCFHSVYAQQHVLRSEWQYIATNCPCASMLIQVLHKMISIPLCLAFILLLRQWVAWLQHVVSCVFVC